MSLARPTPYEIAATLVALVALLVSVKSCQLSQRQLGLEHRPKVVLTVSEIGPLVISQENTTLHVIVAIENRGDETALAVSYRAKIINSGTTNYIDFALDDICRDARTDREVPNLGEGEKRQTGYTINAKTADLRQSGDKAGKALLLPFLVMCTSYGSAVDSQRRTAGKAAYVERLYADGWAFPHDYDGTLPIAQVRANWVQTRAD